MVVTIFGATCMVGRQLTIHALAKGWTVKAFGRNVEHLIDKDLQTEKFLAIRGYVFDGDEVLNAIKGSNAVLSALGGASDGTDKSRSLGIKNIVDQMQKVGVKRIVALGGKGVLPNEDGSYLMDTDDYPSHLIPVSLEHRQAYLYLKNSSLDWTFVCAPDIVSKDADNNFTVKAEALIGDGKINAGNIALFMVEELERNEYVNQRVGISNR